MGLDMRTVEHYTFHGGVALDNEQQRDEPTTNVMYMYIYLYVYIGEVILAN